jgi:hypothetical protein
MLDPIVLAVIIVLISALGAVFFFMNGSSKPEQKKTVDAPPTATKPDATSKPARKEEAVAAAPQLSVPVAAPLVSISLSGAGESERDDSADAALQRVQPEKPQAVQREAECEAKCPITSVQETTPSNSSQDEEQRCPTPPPALEPVTEADLAQEVALVEETVETVETEETEQKENSEEQVVTEPTTDANAQRALPELKEPEGEAVDERESEGEAEVEERVSAYEAAELEEGTDFADASPRPSEDFGEGRGSLTLDTSPLPRTLSSSSSSRPNSLQRHDAAARNVSPMRSPPGGGSRQNQNFGSYYSKKGGDSWIKDSSSTGASAAAASPVSVTPVRHSVPRKVIPTSDDQQPLALRQGQKINQCKSFCTCSFCQSSIVADLARESAW